MIVTCNFKEYKNTTILGADVQAHCLLTSYGNYMRNMKECFDEDSCVIFQTYKLLQNKQQERI